MANEVDPTSPPQRALSHAKHPSARRRSVALALGLLALLGLAAAALRLLDRGHASTRGARNPGDGITTLSILAAQSPDCLAIEIRDASGDQGNVAPRTVLTGCAAEVGCLDPAQQGGVCELEDGMAPGFGAPLDPPPPNPGYTANCLQTLRDIFASRCAATLQATPCLCADDGTQAACLSGATPPSGPLVADYVRSFHSDPQHTKQDIERKFTDPRYGAGMANAIVQCLAMYTGGSGADSRCCRCFGLDAGCGG